MKTTPPASSRIIHQLIATAGVTALTLQSGIIDGWSSPNLARLASPNATIPLTPSEVSWLASSLKLGRFAAIVLLPIFIELAGTRKSILYSFLPVAISWPLIMTAASAWQLYLARFLAGVTYGLTYSCGPIYLGEILTPRRRGTLVSLAMMGWDWGSLASSVCESYLRWMVSCAIYLVPCLMGMTVLAWLPESPYQLVKNGDLEKARESLEWYQGSDLEMMDVREFVEKSRGDVTFKERMKQLGSPVNRRAISLLVLIQALPQICGVFNVIYYMETILVNGGFRLIEPSQVVIYANVLQLAVNLVTINLIDKLGRRVLLIASSLVITVSLTCLGLHYYLLNVDLQWLPVASVIVLLLTFSVGYSTAMSVLLAEIFPSNVKSTAVTIVSFASASSGLASTLAYQSMIDAIGEAFLFWTYAAILASAIPVFLAFVPETKGKSLQEVQNHLNEKAGENERVVF